MTLEGFVRAAGAAMGAARDSFGTGAGEVAPASDAPPVPGGSAPGTGQAAAAFGTKSDQLNGLAAALREQDASARAQHASAMAAANSGRARMDGVIGGAASDVSALAPATTTPHGQRALVTALTRRLQHTQQALQDGQADATTHAAASHTMAADYQTVAPNSRSGATGMSPASGAPMGMSPLAGLGGLPGMMGVPDGAASPGGRSQGQRTVADIADGTGSGAIATVVSRALSQHGTPYVWGGGGPHGPTNGGFDCSSLMQYAFAGVGVDLPRTTYQQIGLGVPVSPGNIRAGDLIFSNFGEGGAPGPGHVQLAISSTHVVEAPHTGTAVQVSAIPAGPVAIRRILR
jgi:peptidoglycan DL-endopeptidase CwlO